MRFRVQFDSTNFDAIGPGEIHLEETGIVVTALFPRVRLPRFVLRAIREVTCEWSQRTIPYSRVTRFTHGWRWSGRRLEIGYTGADGRDYEVRFLLAAPSADEPFAARLEEGRAVARTYLQT